MATPASSATPYANVSDFLQFVDVRPIQDLVQDQGQRVTSSSLQSDTNLAAALLAASGMVEAHAARGSRYVINPAAGVNDLAALTGASQMLLKQIVSQLAFGILFNRRNPLADPPPQYQVAMAFLERLENGDAIFGLVETMTAGRPSHYVENEQDVLGRRMTTSICSRFFGRRSNRYNQSQQ